MLNEHRGALRVKFKSRSVEEAVDVGELNDPLDDCSTVIIGNPDGFNGVELAYRQHWLDEESN